MMSPDEEGLLTGAGSAGTPGEVAQQAGSETTTTNSTSTAVSTSTGVGEGGNEDVKSAEDTRDGDGGHQAQASSTVSSSSPAATSTAAVAAPAILGDNIAQPAHQQGSHPASFPAAAIADSSLHTRQASSSAHPFVQRTATDLAPESGGGGTAVHNISNNTANTAAMSTSAASPPPANASSTPASVAQESSQPTAAPGSADRIANTSTSTTITSTPAPPTTSTTKPALSANPPQTLQYVAPSHLLRLPPRQQAPQPPVLRREDSSHPADAQAMSLVDKEQIEGLRAIRAFLKVRTAYDVLPLSYRTIVFDTSLLVKKSLNALTSCGIVSAPLWDSKTSTFAGMLTLSDYLNVVQYYYQNPDALQQIDQFRLDSLRDIERAIGVSPIETVSTHPLTSLYEACRRMLASRARRIPLVDVDDETRRQMVVSVITQYRILKFVTINVGQTQSLRKPLRDLPHVGTYKDLCVCGMDTPVLDVIRQLVSRSISCVPIVDAHDGKTLLNVFEAVDVLAIIKGGDYDALSMSVGRALEKRPDDFPGIYTCTPNDRLDTIFETIRKSRVHRLVVVDDHKQLLGVLSLSDILDYTLNSPLGDDDEAPR